MLQLRPTLLGLLGAVVLFSCAPQKDDNETAIEPSKDEIDVKIDDLISKMSIEEKAGQMTQVTLSVLMDKKAGGLTFDDQKLKDAIHKYKVGSILNTTHRALTIEEWQQVVTTIQDEALKSDSKIPVLYGVDAIHGATYIVGGTLFPHNLGVGCSRNPELGRRIAEITAAETRASGIRWNFDPVLDVGRNPLWPRFPETFGEDALLCGKLGSGVIHGYEEKGLKDPQAVASCMKHYVGYSDPASGKDRTEAYIPTQQLWDQYLRPFKMAVEAGASTVMINSASINGIPVHGNKYLLNDVLRDSLGFDGMIVTDWEDIIRLHTRHRVAETPKEAVRQGVMAGLDMSMVPNDFSFCELLVELVKEGAVPESRLDESVRRILRLKFDLGIMDDPYPEAEAVAGYGKTEYGKFALEAARQSLVLLENKDDALPLSKDLKVLVAGPAASTLSPLNGSWSFSWQGNVEKNYPDNYKTISEVLTDRLGEGNVLVQASPEFAGAANYDGSSLADKAKRVDAIVLCLGEEAYAESPGVIDDLTLPRDQIELAQVAIATGKPVIVVLAEGRPRVVNDFIEGAKAVVFAPQPGSKGAEAIADLLLGEYSPSGRLCFSYPCCTGDIVPYDHLQLSNIQQITPGSLTDLGYKPQWAFGHGLEYTTFEYSDISLNKEEIKYGEAISVSVNIENTGERESEHIVELYIQDLYASTSPPVRKLKDFTRVSLTPGKSTNVTFSIDPSAFEFIDEHGRTKFEPGEFKVYIGDHEAVFNVNI